MARSFQIAGHMVHPDLNRIVSDDDTTALEPKVMLVLLRLAEAPGEVVTREQLTGPSGATPSSPTMS